MNRAVGPHVATPPDERVDGAASGHAATPNSYGWLVLALASFVGFAILTWVVDSRVSIWFDQPLLDVARGWTGLTWLWNLISDAANFPMIGIGVGIVLWLLKTHRRREAVLVVVLLAVATLGSEVVKELVARPRPVKGPEIGVVYSYASGHVLEAITIFGIISLDVWRSALPRPVRIGVPLLLVFLVILVGVARVALGEHYPSDILGGALAGTGTLSIFAFFTKHRAAASAQDPARSQGVASVGPEPGH